MKRLLLAVGVIWLSGVAAYGQESGTGVGVILGEPTGFTLKHWVDERAAVDAAVGWAFDSGSSFHLHGSWLWHDHDLITVDQGSLPFYLGVGGRLKASSSSRGRGSRTRVGVRLPVGLAYHFDEMPLEIFGEIAPIMDIVPSTRLSLNAAIGVRYYFD